MDELLVWLRGQWQDLVDWSHELIKHYYVVSYIGDDQVGTKTQFIWLKEARNFALAHHAEMVAQYGDEVWTGIEMGRKGIVVVWLIHHGKIAQWSFLATHEADVISGR
jgi:hypothetical protein